MPATVLSNGSRVLTSEVLGLELRLQADSLRFYNPVTGEKLLTHQESEQARREAEQARLEAIPRLLELGLTVEQVAGALGLSVQQVKQAIQE